MKKAREVLGNELHEHKQGILKGLTNVKNGFLEAGKHLMIIKQKKLYRLDGNYVVTFGHWVENELGFGRSAAYHMIDVYDKFGDLMTHPDFKDVDYSKVVMLLPLVNEKTTLEQKESLLHMAAGQSVRGLKDNIKELKGGITSDTCAHPEAEQESWFKCKVCGKFYR